jgi:hypothetical protein
MASPKAPYVTLFEVSAKRSMFNRTAPDSSGSASVVLI